LELFAKATNWKKYWSRTLNAYIKGHVIEVGPGLGTSTKVMANRDHPAWMCLDPDPDHVAHIAREIASGDLPSFCTPKCGVLADLEATVLADTIVYVDVLEHIEDDESEMRTVTNHLQVGGHVIVLSPAFNWLYSTFDQAVGQQKGHQPLIFPSIGSSSGIFPGFRWLFCVGCQSPFSEGTASDAVAACLMG
jgi:2-polyprenyl-3-methyl-5-hydroxy-6-metoxy-1,4-benzoquinol methylase